MLKHIILLSIPLLLGKETLQAKNITVSSPAELKQAVQKAIPGDTVFLENKEWKDAKLVVEGKGTATKPIVIVPRSIGKVIITGQSYLKIAGEYLVIKGLHFKDGYTPEKDLIVFRVNNDRLANNCRLTECVIDEFNNPERFRNENWIVLWGKNNRVDHNTFINKLTASPVLIAELNDERSQDNNHSVDHNYFKGRQRFGSNGGETIRIGVSRYSLTPSRTQIVDNYFEHCNGEVEIVSIKSGENNISRNTFFECEGGLVLRHGLGNVVNGNLFIGNNKPFTGGVRIVNPGHRVTNNVFLELKGTAFRSPLSIMNGVPNSLINRYYQVVDAKIENNTFVNCTPLTFGAGKDAERTLSPQRVTFQKNLFVNASDPVYQDDNNDGGVIVSNNAIDKSAVSREGFTQVKITNTVKNGITVPQAKNYGADLKQLAFITVNQAGAKWYNTNQQIAKNKNTTTYIKASDTKKIQELINKTHAGDTIILAEDGFYKLEEGLIINKPLVIMAAKHLNKKPVFVNASFKTIPAFITIENGGSLEIKNIAFQGAFESYGNVQAGIRSTDKAMNRHYNLTVDGCEFYDYNESSFAGIKASKNTLADSLVIKNSLFRNISGTAVNVAEEKDDRGAYGAEYTIITNTVFTNVMGSAVNVYRGGNDESTLGPFVTIDHCTFNEIENREQGTVVRLVGVQYAAITNSNFAYSGQGGRAIEFREFRWDEILVDYCNFYNAGRVESFYNKVLGKNIYEIDPKFSDVTQLNFKPQNESFLKLKSADGKTIGATIH
ncbi:chondroitinase-B domain-containing protein [Pseudopedobacter beijingensis]|uniref:Chondroitinase-B domain-containing protein n=1 Tax=Pseudopedobacter beijingensis TaxID=1207056 RepID=A0ABW4I7T6_9SPHI